MKSPKTPPKTPAARCSAPAAAALSPVYVPPLSVSHRALLLQGKDEAFRDLIYSMVLSFGRLLSCREAFGREIGLTGSQYTVLIGVAHRQGSQGVSIRALAEHVLLASTHVTTEVGRLIRKGLLQKRPNRDDRRSVLVQRTATGMAFLREMRTILRDAASAMRMAISPRLAISSFLIMLCPGYDEAAPHRGTCPVRQHARPARGCGTRRAERRLAGHGAGAHPPPGTGRVSPRARRGSRAW